MQLYSRLDINIRVCHNASHHMQADSIISNRPLKTRRMTSCSSYRFLITCQLEMKFQGLNNHLQHSFGCLLTTLDWHEALMQFRTGPPKSLKPAQKQQKTLRKATEQIILHLPITTFNR
jgi:hypothetical protein